MLIPTSHMYRRLLITTRARQMRKKATDVAGKAQAELHMTRAGTPHQRHLLKVQLETLGRLVPSVKFKSAVSSIAHWTEALPPVMRTGFGCCLHDTAAKSGAPRKLCAASAQTLPLCWWQIQLPSWFC